MDKSKWIAIEDRLPGLHVSVLVCGRSIFSDCKSVVSVASRFREPRRGERASPANWHTDWIGGYGCEWEMGNIAHWQPLPDLPGE